jgi:hypothetical protein
MLTEISGGHQIMSYLYSNDGSVADALFGDVQCDFYFQMILFLNPNGVVQSMGDPFQPQLKLKLKNLDPAIMIIARDNQFWYWRQGDHFIRQQKEVV